MIDESNNICIGTTHTRLEDPLICMFGIIGVPFFISLFILYSILPRLGMIIPETICHIIIWIVIVVGADIGYITITEPDDTTNEE